MNKYESMFVFSVAKGEEAVTALSEKFQALINANGTLVSAEPFGGMNGVRNLAYEINDETQGAYVLMNYEAAASLPAELERVAGITEGVLRYMTTTKIEKAATKAPAGDAAGPCARGYAGGKLHHGSQV